MAKALIIYYSRTGNTRKMADYITDGLKQEGISYTLVNIFKIFPTAIFAP